MNTMILNRYISVLMRAGFGVGSLAAVLAFSGCSSNGEFSCSQVPNGGCMPMTQAYKESESGITDNRWDFYNGAAAGQVQRGKGKLVIDRTYNVLQSVYEGDAVLTKPKQLRIKLNHFVTDNDALVTGAVMFIKVSDSQWLLEGGLDDIEK